MVGADENVDSSALERFLPESQSGRQRAHHVSVLLVADAQSPMLDRCLSALAAQSRRADEIAGADPADLEDLDPRSARGTLATALARAREQAPEARRPPGLTRSAAWYWILHDDVAPEPDCLAELLASADRNPGSAVFVPKAVGWNDRGRLVGVGHRWAPGTPLVEALDPGERDQGQFDEEREIFAGDSAGMLVRGDVWDALGGLDPLIGDWAAPADLCRRAWGSGHGVTFAPAAVVAHRRAHRIISADRLSTPPEHLPSARRQAREGQLVLALTSRRGLRAGLGNLMAILSTAVRSLALLLTREPEDALAEVAGTWDALSDRRRLRAVRSRAWRTPVSDLRPPREVRAHFGVVAGHAIENWFVRTGLSTWSPRRWRLPSAIRGAAIVAALLAIASVLREPSLLFGPGLLQGGTLLPGTGSVEVLDRYVASWHDVRFGTSAVIPSYAAVMAVMAVPLLGSVDLLVRLVVALAVPLAFLSAMWMLARFPNVGSRTVLAVAYATLPAGVAAVGTGRLGTLMVLILGPVAVRAVVSVLTASRLRVRPCVAAGTVIAAMALFTPVVLTLVPLALVMALLRRSLAGRLILMACVVVIVNVMWVPVLLRDPSMLLDEVGRTDPVLLAGSPRLLALSPGGPGAAAWGGAALVVAAIVIAARSKRRRSAWLVLGSLVGLAGLAWLPWDVWLGVPLLLLGSLLLVALGVGPGPGPGTGAGQHAGRGREPRPAWAAARATPRSPRSALAPSTPTGTVAGLAPLLVAALLTMGWWFAPAGALRSGDPSVLPPVAASAGIEEGRTRTLVLDREADGVHYAVATGTGPRLGDADVLASAGQDAVLQAIVAGIVGGAGGDPVPGLRARAIRYVIVTAPPDDVLMSRVGVLPGLRRIAEESTQSLWLVPGEPIRARLDGQEQDVDIPVSQSPTTIDVDLHPEMELPKQLHLAEADDGGWLAELAGVRLTLEPDEFGMIEAEIDQTGWLLVTHRTAWSYLAIGHLLLIGMVLVIALPKARSLPEDGE